MTPEAGTGKRLFLIDGNSLLYRSYYAIRGLTNSKGFPTNAIYGFVTSLRKLIGTEKPDYLGIVFDTKGPTLRHQAFKDYKAQRKPMPEDLVVQIPVLKELITALRIPLYESQDYEADDVLASLARIAAGRGIHSVIVTTDKDLLQVVDASTSVYNPSKEKTLDEEGVKEFFGVEAGRVADVLSLQGDQSDNIPGVPGIGEKTARTLIAEFGSLENLLTDTSRIRNPKVREKIEGNLETLELSRKLVTIERGLDLAFDLEEFAMSEPDAGEAARIFKDLEFASLLGDFVKNVPGRTRKCTTVLDEKELKALAAALKKAGAFAVDTETDSEFPTQARLVGISFAMIPGEAYYVPLRHDYLGVPAQIPVERALAILKPVLEDPKIPKTGQNIKYDLIVLRGEGVELRGIETDTMVLSYLLEPNWGKHGLERIALHYLGTTKKPYESVAGKGRKQVTLDKVDIDAVAPYACLDADLTLELGGVLKEKVKEAGLDGLYRDIERPLIDLLARMEVWGVKVDTKALKDLSDGFGTDLRRLEKIHLRAGRHGIQHQFPPTAGGHPLPEAQPSRDEEDEGQPGILDLHRHPPGAGAPPPPGQGGPRIQAGVQAEVHLRRRPARAHRPQDGTDPHLLQPDGGLDGPPFLERPQPPEHPGPRGARQALPQAFIPEEGCLFLAADYSQIELRILAHLSDDPALVATFMEDRDIHEETAVRVFGETAGLFRDEMRRRAKIINFSIIYGTSAFSLAKELGTSAGEAQRVHRPLLREVPQGPGVS